MAFRVGQKVVCVDASPARGKVFSPRMPRLRLGEIYTISAAGLVPVRASDGPCVALKEMPWDTGYRERRFRPVVERKTDISIFEKMLTPASKKLVRVSTEHMSTP